jgi:hypothetical protein
MICPINKLTMEMESSVLSVTISTLKKAAKERSFTDLILLRQLLKEVSFFED